MGRAGLSNGQTGQLLRAPHLDVKDFTLICPGPRELLIRHWLLGLCLEGYPVEHFGMV